MNIVQRGDRAVKPPSLPSDSPHTLTGQLKREQLKREQLKNSAFARERAWDTTSCSWPERAS
jgi:hypothetical protein